VPELIRHTIFEGIEPNVMKGIDLTSGEKNYPCPIEDFGISKLELKAGETYTTEATSLEIIVIMDGELSIEGSNALTAKSGEVVAVLAGETYTVSTLNQLYAYKAFVP
jgi:mannose-6-phosphate isomerase